MSHLSALLSGHHHPPGRRRCEDCEQRDRILSEYPRVCPVCDRHAIYAPTLDRYVHSDGSSNRFCWAAISSRSGTDYSDLEPPMSDTLWPLAIVAAELGCGTRELINRCNGAVVRNEDGLRCIPGDLVKELVGETHARLAAQRAANDHIQRALMESSTVTHERRRIRALRERQQRHGSIDNSVPLTESALSNLIGNDTVDSLEAAGQRWDEMASGATVYHSITGKDK